MPALRPRHRRPTRTAIAALSIAALVTCVTTLSCALDRSGAEGAAETAAEPAPAIGLEVRGGITTIRARPPSGALRLRDEAITSSSRACAGDLCVTGGIVP